MRLPASSALASGSTGAITPAFQRSEEREVAGDEPDQDDQQDQRDLHPLKPTSRNEASLKLWRMRGPGPKRRSPLRASR